MGPRSAAGEETCADAAEAAALSETTTLDDLGLAVKRVFCVQAQAGIGTFHHEGWNFSPLQFGAVKTPFDDSRSM